MPTTRAAAPYRLYIDARRVWRSKIGWELSREETTRILTDVRQAADLGDWGARALLARFYLRGLGVLESNHVLDADPVKSVELARQAANAGQPWGFYDLGVAYEHGYGGAHYDRQIAWAYYLKAAELGSPDAQMALAAAYSAAGRREDEITMLQCAYQQGHGEAAYQLGIKARVNEQYQEALNIYQQGVKFGNKNCSSVLSRIFSRGHMLGADEQGKRATELLGITSDPERKARYLEIFYALEINPDLRLTRLDQVLPLPPQPLPPWSGVSDAMEPESGVAGY